MIDTWQRWGDYLVGVAVGLFAHWFVYDHPEFVVRPVAHFLCGEP